MPSSRNNYTTEFFGVKQSRAKASRILKDRITPKIDVIAPLALGSRTGERRLQKAGVMKMEGGEPPEAAKESVAAIHRLVGGKEREPRPRACPVRQVALSVLPVGCALFQVQVRRHFLNGSSRSQIRKGDIITQLWASP
jgi:hypothetical protein